MNNIEKLILLLAVTILSCQTSNQEKTLNDQMIKVSLNKEKISKVFGGTLRPFAIIEDQKSIKLGGIPKLDTFLLQYYTSISTKKLIDLYNKGDIDSTKIPLSEFKNRIYGINGYLGDKQIIVIDANNNLDFSDDKIITVNKALKYEIDENLSLRDSFPVINLDYDFFDGKNVIQIQTAIRPQTFINTYPKKEDKLKNELSILAHNRESFHGVFNLSNKDYKVAINTQSIFGKEILIVQENKEFPKRFDPTYFSYNIKDTIKIGDRYYSIDSINPAVTDLYIKDLKLDSKQYGYRQGERVQNFNFKSLEDKEYNFTHLLRRKKYVLMDFWGTWCAPCIELTPDLVALNKKFNEDVNLLSIAYDLEKQPVIDYVEKHKLDWNHHFLKGNAKSRKNTPRLIKDLNIEAYPTFILIDKKMNIVYRGSGKDALKEIENIITASIQ